MKWSWPPALFSKVAPVTIKGKLTFWFLFLSLAPILAVGMMAYTNSRGSLEREIINKLDAVADNKSYILNG